MVIDTTDEDIEDNVIKHHLIKLGLKDLIKTLIPDNVLAINVQAFNSFTGSDPSDN